jgi:hypothetical protein
MTDRAQAPRVVSIPEDSVQLAAQLAKMRVMVVGRGWAPEQGGEYPLMFGLTDRDLAGKVVWDIAGGVASFIAEARGLGATGYALDPLYGLPQDEVQTLAVGCLDQFQQSYTGDDFVEANGQRAAWLVPNPTEAVDSVPKLLKARSNSLAIFFKDRASNPGSYIDFSLPGIEQEQVLDGLPQPDLITIGNCLMAYAGKEEFNLDFHVQSLSLAYQRLKPGGTVRVFPFGEDGVSFGLNAREGRGFEPRSLLEKLSEKDIPFRVVPRTYAFVRGWTHGLELMK